MGVPGLWRLLDLASSPMNLEDCQNIRIAIDIHSHLNKLVHGQNASNWLFTLAKDLFRVIHFNIRVVVVFMGKRSVQKIYSQALGDESQEIAYYRVRSALLRATKESPERHTSPKRQECKEELTFTESMTTKQKRINPIKLGELSDPAEVSMRQVETIGKQKPSKPPMTVSRPSASNPFVVFEKKTEQVNEDLNEKKKDTQITKPEKPLPAFTSDLLNDIQDILLSDDPSSEGIQPPVEEDEIPDDFQPISLLPADNPYLPPIENYVTASHVRMVEKLCNEMGIEFVHAPEESSAECARLEKEGIVDAVASDDNNTVLFGSRWMIRGIFTKPQSITIETLERVGLTRKRMIMLAMMIDGDYNSDIRRRLFTVGPVRGMEIVSLFPDQDYGLLQFKEWWIRVVKNKKEEKNPDLRHFSKKKWLNRLIIPAEFPPQNLLEAFKNPVVGDTKPKAKLPKFNFEKLVKYLIQTCSVSEQRIKEYVMMFEKRLSTFTNTTLKRYVINDLKYQKSFQEYIDRLKLYFTTNEITGDDTDTLSNNMNHNLNDEKHDGSKDKVPLSGKFLEKSTSCDGFEEEEFITASESDSIESS